MAAVRRTPAPPPARPRRALKALEALALDVGALQEEGFLAPEAHARDGGEVDRVVQGGGGPEEPPARCHPEAGGETVCGVRTQERAGVPGALEDVRRETAAATVTEAQGGGGEAVNVCAVQEVVLQRLFGEQVG